MKSARFIEILGEQFKSNEEERHKLKVAGVSNNKIEIAAGLKRDHPVLSNWSLNEVVNIYSGEEFNVRVKKNKK